MRRLFAFLSAALLIWPLSAQPADHITWEATAGPVGNGRFELRLKGTLSSGMHSYPLGSELNAPSVEYELLENCEAEGALKDNSTVSGHNGENVVYTELLLSQTFRLTGAAAHIRGSVAANICDNFNNCYPPEYHDFEVRFDGGAAALSGGAAASTSDGASVSESSSATADADGEAAGAATGGVSKGASLWSLILSAILWGFAMLLTPCVFPMIPMTVSFFLKSSSKPAQGRFKAFMYGLFIVLLYTVPISLVIFITWIFGGDSVTADIFNWLATHWLPNIIFFIVFMLFAASFFGAFEITMPSSLVNRADSKSDKGGLAGVFFMALTLVLVSFSCTGPIVGTVLIQSTQGQFWAPMVTMLAFSVAFALPFTVFALFPSLLTKLKSGSWLNSVKVVLGFVELALGLKFLSVADQTYHWGILDREVYLALWIVIFTLLGFYLLGKIRFKYDEPVEKLGITRLTLSIAVFAFVVYMIPGMFGAPLKALSGYLPPITSQDFVLSQSTAALPAAAVDEDGPDLELPYGLRAYSSLDKGIAAATKAGKPVFVDISGHGCVNCREMESRVWSDPRVHRLLAEKYVIVALYLDDKTKLPEEEWVQDGGRVYKDLGRRNSYIARERFNVNAQPNYVILSPEGKQLTEPRGYDLDVEGYVRFLENDSVKAR